MGPIVAGATPSTTDSVSRKDAEPTNRSQDLTNLAAAPDATIKSEQRSSSPSDVDLGQPENSTSTTTAITASSAHVVSAAALTEMGSETSEEKVDASRSEESESVQSEFVQSESVQSESVKSKPVQSKSESETEKTQYRDDLTCIEGVDEETQQAFYDAGYYRYSDIENATSYDLKQVFAGRELKFSHTDFKNWSVQASLSRLYQSDSPVAGTEPKAASGDRHSQSDSNVSKPTQASSKAAGDDLTKIQGIGPATAELLKKSGIRSFRSLHETKPGQLKTILRNGGSKFKLVDSSSWTEQTRFAMNGDWIGLADWTATHGSATEEVSLAATSSQATISKTLLETNASKSPATSEAGDDLTKIHGIGPATAEHLQTFGITSFRSLHQTNPNRLQTIVKNGGPKFKSVDSSSWIEQSRFAMNGDWNGLSKWAANHSVATGESLGRISISPSPTTGNSNESNVKKQSKSHDTVNALTVGSTTADDLTKIHGLGKASQKVLNDNEIFSFAQVASMTSQQLDRLFSESPRRFKLIKTSTWPAQAKQFATAESTEEVSSQILEAEIFDEIDSIREIATSAETSSSVPRKKKQASKRD